MEANLRCPHCNGVMTYAAELAGQTVACPHCQAHFKMPVPAPTPVAIAGNPPADFPAVANVSNTAPAPSSTGDTLPTRSPGTRLAVLILTIVAGLFSLVIGGCTASVHEGVAQMGEDLSRFDQRYGDGRDAARIRSEAKEMRSQGGAYMGLALLQMLLGIGGGVFAYMRYDNPADVQVGNVRMKHLSLAGIAIIAAAVLTLFNCFSFITAGLMNTIAGILTLLRASALTKSAA